MDRITTFRAFARLVERESFTAVADEMQVKQSTVSKWLRALEDELGVQLLVRTTRAVHVTEAGHRFYARALVAIEAHDAAVHSVGEDRSELRGRIRMNVPEVFGRLYVVPKAAAFAQRHPGVELDLVLQDSYVQLVEEGVDLAIRVGPSPDSTLRAQVLAQTPRRLVASPGYLKRRGLPRAPSDLREHECLLHSGALGRTWVFTVDGRTQRVGVRGRIRVSNSEAALILARRGMGICLLASWLVDADLRAGRLVQLLPEIHTGSARITALTPPSRCVPLRVRALIEDLRAGFAPLAASSAAPRAS